MELWKEKYPEKYYEMRAEMEEDAKWGLTSVDSDKKRELGITAKEYAETKKPEKKKKRRTKKK